MTHKKVDNEDAGTTDIFGGNDLDKWSDFASGVDTDDYDINADTQFREDKFQIRNSANTFGHKHRSLATAARTITYPDQSITVGDTTNSAGPTYLVYKDGSNYKAKNSVTGMVDSTSTSPATVIQYALDNLTASRTWKETVKLRGMFQFPQIFLNSYTTLDLTEAYVKQSNGTNANFISNSDKTNGNINIEIVGGTIDGNNYSQSAGGTEDGHSMVFFKKCSSVWMHHGVYRDGDFHNVRWVECPVDMQFTNNTSIDPRHEHVSNHSQFIATGICHNHVISNNVFQNITGGPSGANGQTYISTVNVSDVLVSNNTCVGMFGGTSSFAVNGLRQIIIGNTISGPNHDGFGINLGQLPGAAYNCSGSIVVGNTVKNIARYGIQAQGQVISNIIISNNIVDTITLTPDRGIYVVGCLDSIISDNIVHDCAGSGIVVRGVAAIGQASRTIVSGNICYNNGKTLDVSDVNRCGITVFGAAAGEADNIDVVNNKCYDIQGTKTQKWGVRLVNTNNCTCKNNDVRNNLTAGILDTTNTGLIIGGNLGYLTANADTSGLATIALLETEVNELKATLRAIGIIG